MPKAIICRGIGEGLNSSLLARVYNQLLGWEIVNLPWKAEYGPFPQILGVSFDVALAEGYKLLRAELDKGPAVVIGYSGGAALAGNVAAEGHKNLIAVGLVADPFQPAEWSRNGHFGIAGSRPITGVPVMWKYDLNDGICQTPRFSPLRTLADQSEAFSLADPGAWTTSLWLRLIAKRWQPVNLGADLRAQYDLAGRLLWGYLHGDHTSYAIRKEANGRTYTDNLAEWVKQFD